MLAFRGEQRQHQILLLHLLWGLRGQYTPKGRYNLIGLGEERDIGHGFWVKRLSANYVMYGNTLGAFTMG